MKLNPFAKRYPPYAGLDADDRYHDHFGKFSGVDAFAIEANDPTDFIKAVDKAIKTNTPITEAQINKINDKLYEAYPDNVNI